MAEGSKRKKPLGAAEIAARCAVAGTRARAEAEPRRQTEASKPMAKEIGGPKGLEPTRYGDWEKKGLISDF
jgi:hypothetical protein